MYTSVSGLKNPRLGRGKLQFDQPTFTNGMDQAAYVSRDRNAVVRVRFHTSLSSYITTVGFRCPTRAETEWR